MNTQKPWLLQNLRSVPMVVVMLSIVCCATDPNKMDWSADTSTSTTAGSEGEDSSTHSPVSDFTGSRTETNCSQSYAICDAPAECILDTEHYIEWTFPGTHRFVIENTVPDTQVELRLFFVNVTSQGTEFLVQLRQPDCTIDTETGKFHLEGVEIETEVREDHGLSFALDLPHTGEHLVEMYTDARADCLATIGAL
jgi:hypothetical protein